MQRVSAPVFLPLAFAILAFGSLVALSEEVRLSREGGVYHLPVRVNNAIELKFIVDTGAAHVQIPEDVAMTLIRTGTISKSDFLGIAAYQTADGSMTNNAKLNLRSLQVGSRIIRNVEASVGPVEGPLLLGQSALGEIEPWWMDTKRGVFVFESSETVPSDFSDQVARAASTISMGSSRQSNDVEVLLRNFVDRTNARDLAGLMSLYSKTIDYFDRGALPAKDVRTDKLYYFRNWDVIATEQVGTPNITRQNNQLNVQFEITFLVKNHKKKKVITGRAINILRLVRTRTGLRIAGEDQKVIKRDTH